MIVTLIQHPRLDWSLMKQTLTLAKRPRVILAGHKSIPRAIFDSRDLSLSWLQFLKSQCECKKQGLLGIFNASLFLFSFNFRGEILNEIYVYQ